MTPEELATFLREEVPRLKDRANELRTFTHYDILNCLSALDAAVGLIRDLSLAIGHESGCLKLTVGCSCGKATQLTAAHQQGAYIVRAIKGLKKESNSDD